MADYGTAGTPDPNPTQPPQPPQPPQPQEPGWQSASPEYGPGPAAAAWPSPPSEYGSYQTPPPAGAPWMYGPYQQPPKKPRTGLIVGLAVGAGVLLLAGGLAVVGLAGASKKTTAQNDGNFTPAAPTPRPSSSSPAPTPTPTPTRAAPGVTLKIPGSVAGFEQMNGSIAKRSIQALRRGMDKASSLSDKSKIAIYTKGSSRLIFVGISGADSPRLAAELSASPSSEVDSVFIGGGITNPKDYPAGSIGGVLRCGKLRQQGISVAICAWADPSALITLQASGVSVKELSSIMLSFHDASVRKGIPAAPA
jgi:hypothetical protein